jgi:hypothetical protein
VKQKVLAESFNKIDAHFVAAADLSVVSDFDLQSTFPNIDQRHTYPCCQMQFGMDWWVSVCFFQVRDPAAGIVANADTKFRH